MRLWILTLGFQHSGLAAALALSVMMLPYMIRASDLALRLVPGSLREASAALGAPLVAGRAPGGDPDGAVGTGHRGDPGHRPGDRRGVAGAADGGVHHLHQRRPAARADGLAPARRPEAGPDRATPNYTARAFAAASFLLLLVIVLFVTARKVGGWGPGHLTDRGLRRVREASARDARPLPAEARRRRRRSPAGYGADPGTPEHRSRHETHGATPITVHLRSNRLLQVAVAVTGGVAVALVTVARPRPARRARRPTCRSPATGLVVGRCARPVDRRRARRRDPDQLHGRRVDDRTGQLHLGQSDFAASDIPFQTNPDDGSRRPSTPRPGATRTCRSPPVGPCSCTTSRSTASG